MKKLFLILVATTMVAFASAKEVAASDTASKEPAKVEFSLNVRDLSRPLGLNYDQYDVLEESCKALNERMHNALKYKAIYRSEEVNSALRENLSIAYCVLSTRQYREYLNILNSEFNKSGMNTMLFQDEVADNTPAM